MWMQILDLNSLLVVIVITMQRIRLVRFFGCDSGQDSELSYLLRGLVFFDENVILIVCC